MLKARAQVMLEANLSRPAPGVAEHFGETVYQSVLKEYRREASGEA